MKRKYLWGYPRAVIGSVWLMALLGGAFFGTFAFVTGFPMVDNIQQLRLGIRSWYLILSLVIQVPIFLFSSLFLIGGIPRFIYELLHKQFDVKLQAFTSDMCTSCPDPRDPMNHYGWSLARHCRKIDELADRIGVLPLYELGIRQENEPTNAWFPSIQGIQTVDALLNALSEPQLEMEEKQSIVRDLEMLRTVLCSCERFHLMLA